MLCKLTQKHRFGACSSARWARSGTRTRTVVSAEARDVDVAVVGGGPAGCVTAIALERMCPQLSVTVLERASALRPVGGALGIGAPNGLAAVRCLGSDVYDALLGASMRREAYEIGVTEDTIRRIEIEQFDTSTTGMQIAWYDMQQTLKAFIKKSDFHVASGVMEVVEQPDGRLMVSLANGSQVRCKLLVGADGNRSEVRSQFVAPAEHLFYVGCCAWRFWLPAAWPDLPPKTSRVLEKDGKTFTFVNLPRQNDNMEAFGTVFVPFPEDKLGILNQSRYIQDTEDDAATLKARLDRMSEAIGDTHPRSRVDFIREHATVAGTLEHPVWALDPDFPWTRGMAVLVGDAAHVMPAHMSQGAPMAFEDAVQLAASVSEHGLSLEALQHYEQARKPRVLPVWEAATESAIQWYQYGNPDFNAFADFFNPKKTKKPRNPYIEGVIEIVNSYAPPHTTALQS